MASNPSQCVTRPAPLTRLAEAPGQRPVRAPVAEAGGGSGAGVCTCREPTTIAPQRRYAAAAARYGARQYPPPRAAIAPSGQWQKSSHLFSALQAVPGDAILAAASAWGCRAALRQRQVGAMRRTARRLR